MSCDNQIKGSNSNAYCCVPQCKGFSRKNPNLSFHHFPRVRENWPKADQDRILRVRQEWIRVLKIKRDVSNSMVVCSSHFKRSDYFPSDNVRKRYLKKTAIPSFNLPLSSAELNAKKIELEEKNALGPNVVYVKKAQRKKGRWCAVLGCKNRKGNTTNVSFFSFPKNPDVRKEWIVRCGRRTGIKPNSSDCTICSDHFTNEDFSKDRKPGPLSSKPKRLLRKGSLPSRNLPKGNTSQKTKIEKKNQVKSKCCVPKCKSKNDEAMFYFPETQPLRSLWLKFIPRENFKPTIFSKICEKHFKPSDLIQATSTFNGKNNQFTGCRTKLREQAVPSIICEAPDSPTAESQDSSSDEDISAESNPVGSPLIVKFQQRKIADESGLEEASDYTESKDSDCAESGDSEGTDNERDVADGTIQIEMIQRIDFIDLNELEQKLPSLDLSDFWTVVKSKKSLAFVHLKLTKYAPKILYSVVIDENLSASLFHGEERVKASKNFSFPMKVRNIVKLKMILNEAKAKTFTATESSNKVELVQSLLDSLKQDMKKQEVKLSFLKEQLSLLTDKQKQYSADTLLFATLLFSLAPHAYKFLIQYGNLILPELDTVKNLFVPLQASPCKDVPPVTFLQHAKESFWNLKYPDTQIALQMEEICLKQFLEVDGNIAGMSLEMDAAATSVYVFTIASLCSNYRDTVHLLPVQTSKAKEIHTALKEVITALECIGFHIVTVVTDDSLVNRQVMSFFSEPPIFGSFVHKHPLDSSRPLFHIISCAYLLKSIRNDWMCQNNQDECIFYPDIGNETDKQSIKKASFTTLKRLYDVESSSYLKCYSSVSSKAIFPTGTEKFDMEYVLQIFNDIVSDRLLLYGEDHELNHYQDTADFIKLICTWWSVVNPYSLPSESMNGKSLGTLSMYEKSYAFLQKFLDWLDSWSDTRYDSGMLTAKTYSALHLSTYSLIKLTAYCKKELGRDFILPGNFQTDFRIIRFGCSRESSSLQFIHEQKWSSYELKLQALSNLALTLIEVDDVDLTGLHCKQTASLTEAIDFVNTFIPMIVSPEDMTSNEGNIPVLLYLGWHCACSVLKELNCEQCESHLLTDVNMVLHPAVCENDEELLLYPSKNTMNVVVLSFIVLSKLCNEYACEFWTKTNRNSLAYNLTLNIVESFELGLNYRLCKKGHSLSKAVKMIVRSVVYNILNNHKSSDSDKMELEIL